MPEKEPETEDTPLPDDTAYVYFCGWCGLAVAGFLGHVSEPDDFFWMRKHAEDHWEEIPVPYNTDMMRGELFLDLENEEDLTYLKKFFPELSDGTKRRTHSRIDLSTCNVSPVIAPLLEKGEVELVPERGGDRVINRYRETQT